MENNKTVYLSVSEKDKVPSNICPHCRKGVDPRATKCPYCQSKIRPKNDMRNLLLTALAVIFGIPILIALVVSSSGSNNPSDTPSYVSIPKTICDQDQTTLQKNSQQISYKQLSKAPISFQGQITTFRGQILQIQQSGNEGFIRLSVTDLGSGYWSSSDVIYVTYHQSTPAVEGDIVSVTGQLTGTKNYTSQANFQITIPRIDVCSVNTSSPAKSVSDSSSKTTTLKTDNTQTQSSSQPTPTQTTYTTPSGTVINQNGTIISQPASWHTAYNFSAKNVNTKTPTFYLQGKQQKISYTCLTLGGDDPNGGIFNGTIHSVGGYNSDIFALMVSCPISNSTYEYDLSAGQYYLDLSQINSGYTVTVEDYY